MLILTRRVGETLMIGDDITVTVLGVKGNQVRIGVNAPKEVSVHREEIYDRIKDDTNAGSQASQPTQASEQEPGKTLKKDAVKSGGSKSADKNASDDTSKRVDEVV